MNINVDWYGFESMNMQITCCSGDMQVASSCHDPCNTSLRNMHSVSFQQDSCNAYFVGAKVNGTFGCVA